MKPLLLLFLLTPLLELYLLIELGSLIGPPLTITLVILTALIGATLVRTQGLTTLTSIQSQLAQAQLPAQTLIEAMLIFAAGALLLTPGFLTDTIGFALLIPRLRRQLAAHLLTRRLFRPPPPPPNQPQVIDADYTKLD